MTPDEALDTRLRLHLARAPNPVAAQARAEAELRELSGVSAPDARERVARAYARLGSNGSRDRATQPGPSDDHDYLGASVDPVSPYQQAAQAAGASAGGLAPSEIERIAGEEDPGLDHVRNSVTDPLKSDAELASAVAEYALGGHFRWAAGLGWRFYQKGTGTWEHVPEEAVGEVVRRYFVLLAAHCLRLALGQMREGKSTKFYDDLAGSWRSRASASRIMAVTRLARGICLVPAERFDSHPDLLNCGDGVLDLRTLELGEHDPELYFTKCTGVAWQPDARHPDIERALEAIPADVREYAQLRYGQALTGHKPPDDAIGVQHGTGENGKTTVMLAIRHAAGDYSAILPSHLLLADPRAHTTDLMTLRGVRLGIIEELPEDHQLSVNRIKVASAPEITARLMHRDNVTFANACSLFISTNYRPQIRETDRGTWRRLEGSIPYPFTFRKPHEALANADDRKGDATLRQRIETDPGGPRARAMLRWLAEGAQRWYAGEDGRDGMTMGQPPRRVRDDLAEWRESCDLLSGYLAERAEFAPDSHIAAADLLAAFNQWAKGRGHSAWSAETLAARFAAHAEVREHNVTKRRVRADGIQGQASRPGMYLERLPGMYQAWFGVRFRTQADGQADDETAGRAGCAGQDVFPMDDPSRKGFMNTPAHPAHPHLPGHLPWPSAADWQAMWDVADHAA